MQVKYGFLWKFFNRVLKKIRDTVLFLDCSSDRVYTIQTYKIVLRSTLGDLTIYDGLHLVLRTINDGHYVLRNPWH